MKVFHSIIGARSHGVGRDRLQTIQGEEHYGQESQLEADCHGAGRGLPDCKNEERKQKFKARIWLKLEIISVVRVYLQRTRTSWKDRARTIQSHLPILYHLPISTLQPKSHGVASYSRHNISNKIP